MPDAVKPKSRRINVWLLEDDIKNLDDAAAVLFPYRPANRRSEIVGRLARAVRAEGPYLVVDERPHQETA